MKYLAPLALFAVLLGFLAVGLNLNPREVPSPFIGKPAPAFDAAPGRSGAAHHQPGSRRQGLDPERLGVVVRRLPRDKPSVLAFESARRGKVPIYGLNYKDERGDAITWLSLFGNPYAAWLSDTDGRVGIDFGVYGIPETFVIDKHGVVRFKQIRPGHARGAARDHRAVAA